MKTTNRSRRAADGLTAADIMAKGVVTVSPGAPLSEVERVLSENRVSGVPVVDSAGRALGVVSLRDLIDRYAEDPDARPRRGTNFYRLPTEHMNDEEFEGYSVRPEGEETAENVMNAEIIQVRRDASVADVARKMVDRSIHRVLVTDEQRRLVGIISSMNVLAAIAGKRASRASPPPAEDKGTRTRRRRAVSAPHRRTRASSARRRK